MEGEAAGESFPLLGRLASLSDLGPPIKKIRRANYVYEKLLRYHKKWRNLFVAALALVFIESGLNAGFGIYLASQKFVGWWIAAGVGVAGIIMFLTSAMGFFAAYKSKVCTACGCSCIGSVQGPVEASGVSTNDLENGGIPGRDMHGDFGDRCDEHAGKTNSWMIAFFYLFLVDMLFLFAFCILALAFRSIFDRFVEQNWSDVHAQLPNMTIAQAKNYIAGRMIKLGLLALSGIPVLFASAYCCNKLLRGNVIWNHLFLTMNFLTFGLGCIISVSGGFYLFGSSQPHGPFWVEWVFFLLGPFIVINAIMGMYAQKKDRKTLMILHHVFNGLNNVLMFVCCLGAFLMIPVASDYIDSHWDSGLSVQVKKNNLLKDMEKRDYVAYVSMSLRMLGILSLMIALIMTGKSTAMHFIRKQAEEEEDDSELVGNDL
eukprot:GILI01011936.1.p1 GENE.GILI01011936.1~~GILI01011936.1.p1  ORF type:complete len:430 (+),score=128.24 GILI01011936.1:99-1388(+)